MLTIFKYIFTSKWLYLLLVCIYAVYMSYSYGEKHQKIYTELAEKNLSNVLAQTAQYESFKEALYKQEKEALITDSKLTQEKLNAKIQTINTNLSNALDSVAMLKRTKRPDTTNLQKDLPASTCTENGATGQLLYREDAEFLTRQAALADVIVSERDGCYTMYNIVRGDNK